MRRFWPRLASQPPGPVTQGAYDRLARFYDWSGAADFSDACLTATRDALARLAHAPRNCLDIACGTGTFVIEMERQGLAAVGIDRSHAMLQEARAKAYKLHSRPLLVCADMRDFTLRARFDLVTCFYDALNHVTDAAGAAAAIGNAARHLAPGGIYLFDTNNERMFERVWSGPRETIDVGTGLVEIDYRYDPVRGSAAAQVTFRRRGEAPISGWVHERCHPRAEIEDALGRAGLELVCRDPHPYFRGSDASLKDLWLCRKP